MTRPLNILLVDDDEDDAFFIERVIQRAIPETARVRWVARYQEALQALLEGGVDAALVDYRLGPHSGIDLIAGARADGCSVPMILLTGQGDSRVDDEAMRAGAQDYLVKHDLDPTSLARSIRYAVERSRNDSLLVRMGRIMDASANEILLFDAGSLRCVHSNSTARRSLGYDRRQIAELELFDVLAEESHAELRSVLAMLAEGCHGEATFEGLNRRRDGDTYPVEVHLQLFENERPPLYLATVMDLSERRRREEQLRRAQKMDAVGQLAGGLAHDFNNLLTVISGNLELVRLSEERALGEDGTEMIDEAATAARRGADLTRRLLAFSRQQPLEAVAVDAGALVSGMSEMLRRTLGTTIRVETLVSERLPPVVVDAAQLENAVLNLAINARDAMPDGGLLRIEVDADGELLRGTDAMAPGVAVRVIDTGAGIEPQVLSQVFEPFYTTKDAGQGTGLGLSMVYGFVRQSGGDIDIQSELGAGTTVTLAFPAADGMVPDTDLDVGDPVQAPRGKERILLVEDDDSVRRFAALTLTMLGYRVTAAASVEEAVALLEGGLAPELVFTDLHLPGGGSGNDLVRLVRESHPALPVLVTSGFSERHDYQDYENVKFLPKPFGTQALARRVRNALDTRTPVTAARS